MEDLITGQRLVSIIVITYNSAKYVIETLESAKAQTYKNIELIISDDCSKDITISICQKWLADNKERFVNTQLLTVKENTGISPNCNRGLKAAKGEWIKLIAGDDLLGDNVIQKNIEFSLSNTDAKLIVSKIAEFEGDRSRAINPSPNTPVPTDIKQQFKLFLKANIVQAPAVMIKTELLKQLNGFDERFLFIEDYPLWIKCMLANEKFYFNPESFVYHRIHHQSISNKRSITGTNPLLFNSFQIFATEILYPLMKKKKMFGSFFLRKASIEITGYLMAHPLLNPTQRYFYTLVLRIINRLYAF